MFDDFGGPGFDWNGNGTKDSFDHYMDMKAAGSGGGGRSQGEASARKKSSGGIVIYDSSKDSDGVALVKALTVCCLCLGGMVLAVMSNTGDLGTALCLLGGPALSIIILKSHKVGRGK